MALTLFNFSQLTLVESKKLILFEHKNPQFQKISEDIDLIYSDFSKASNSLKDDLQFNGLLDEITQLKNLLHSSDALLCAYQIDFLSNILIPYLKKITGRYHTDKSRFSQLSQMIHAIRYESSEGSIDLTQSSMNKSIKYLNCLNSLDKVKDEIALQQQNYMFPSDLLRLLETSLLKEWMPITNSLRNFLQDLGGKMLIFGIVGVFAWPMMLFIPLFQKSKQLLHMLNELDRQKTLSNQSKYELFKIVVVLISLWYILSFIQYYASIGYLALIFSMGLLTLSFSEPHLKLTAPIILPRLKQFQEVMITNQNNPMVKTIADFLN